MKPVRLPFSVGAPSEVPAVEPRGGPEAADLRDIHQAAELATSAQQAATQSAAMVQAQLALAREASLQREHEEQRVALELHARAIVERASGNRKAVLGAGAGVFGFLLLAAMFKE